MAYLVSKAIRKVRTLAFNDLCTLVGHEFVVEDMSIAVAVDARAQS